MVLWLFFPHLNVEFKGEQVTIADVRVSRQAPTGDLTNQEMALEQFCIAKGIAVDERTDECQVCGLVIDRDLNAALNLEQLITMRLTGSYGCGEEKSMPAPELDQVLFHEAGTECRSI